MKGHPDKPVMVVGSSNTDLVLRLPRLPRPGETLSGGALRHCPGGKGANQAVAVARAGVQVHLVGACGRDAYGREARRFLKSEGVGLRWFRSLPDTGSGVALIFVDEQSGENVIGVSRSANHSLGRPDLLRASKSMARCGVVLAQLEIPFEAVESAAELAAGYGIPFLLNPAPVRAIPRNFWPRVSLAIPNEEEARELTGEKNIEDAAGKFVDWGCAAVLVTLGARGVLCRTAAKGPARVWKAPRVDAVDTVGAGDCFCGWMAACLSQCWDVEWAAHTAMRAAALAVTRVGAAEAMPLRIEVENQFGRIKSTADPSRVPDPEALAAPQSGEP